MTAQELIAAHQSEHGKMPSIPYSTPTGKETILRSSGQVKPINSVEELPDWLVKD